MEVNSFMVISITNNLRIDGNNIVDLIPLSTITSVGGDLYIYDNDVLTSLAGLDNIVSVSGSLNVSYNARLNGFCGLYPMLSSGGLGGNYFVFGNLVNPTRQKIIDDGTCILSAVAENELKSIYYKLQKNYPNPFNPNTKISYSVSNTNHVSFSIYNELGKKVASLVDEIQSENYYTVDLNISDLTSGTYFYVLKIGDTNVETMKMLLIR